MKKILITITVILLSLTLIGCTNEETKEKDNKKFEGTYSYNPPKDNFYVETENTIIAKVGKQYTYFEKEDTYNYHIHDDYKKVYVYYEGEWVIDSNLTYNDYKDDYKNVFPFSAMEDYFMKYFKAYGYEEEKLKDYYVGMEKVAGVNCWVFDSKGLNGIYTKYWIDPSNGVTLKYENYKEGEKAVEVIKYDLDYTKMDENLVPNTYEGLETW